MLANLCPPALIYLVFSTTQIVIDTIKGFHNTAFLKIWVTFAFTVLLNFLCEKGLGIVSWIIVFIPFILMTLIISILLIMFGLDPATGKSKSYKGGKGNKPKKGDKNISGATLKPGYDKRRKGGGKGWAIKGGMDKGWVVKPMTFGKDKIQKAYDEDESEDEEDKEDKEKEDQEDEDKEQVKEGPDNRKRGTDKEWDKRNLKGGVPAHSHKVGHTLDGASYPGGKKWKGFKKPSMVHKKAEDQFRKDQKKESSKAGAVSEKCDKYCKLSCVGSCKKWGCPICEGKGIAPAKAEDDKKTDSSCSQFCGKGKACTKQCKKWGCSNCCPDPPSDLKTICKNANKKCNTACTKQAAQMCLVNQNYLNPRKCCIRWAPCMILNKVNKEGFGGLVPEGFKHGRVI